MFHNVFHRKQHIDTSCFHISLAIYLISLWAHHTTSKIQGISYVRKKNQYKAWRRVSNWMTELSFYKNQYGQVVQWVKQCTSIKNDTTFSFIRVVTPTLTLWNTLLPLQPIEISFALDSSTFRPPKVTMVMSIKWKIFSVFPYTPNLCTKTRNGINFHP